MAAILSRGDQLTHWSLGDLNDIIDESLSDQISWLITPLKAISDKFH